MVTAFSNLSRHQKLEISKGDYKVEQAVPVLSVDRDNGGHCDLSGKAVVCPLKGKNWR